MTAQTSQMALARLYAEDKLSPARKAMILALEEMEQPLTRWEIQKYLELSGYSYKINSVTPRVNELVQMGVIVEDGTTKKCSVTGQTAKLVRLAR